MAKTATIQEGKKVEVGDWVSFKSDIEQYGEVIAIVEETYRTVLTLQNEDGFDGEYIGGETRTKMNAEDCWDD